MMNIVMCSARTSHEPIFIVEAASSMLVSKDIFFDRVARTHRSVVLSRAIARSNAHLDPAQLYKNAERAKIESTRNVF